MSYRIGTMRVSIQCRHDWDGAECICIDEMNNRLRFSASVWWWSLLSVKGELVILEASEDRLSRSHKCKSVAFVFWGNSQRAAGVSGRNRFSLSRIALNNQEFETGGGACDLNPERRCEPKSKRRRGRSSITCCHRWSKSVDSHKLII